MGCDVFYRPTGFLWLHISSVGRLPLFSGFVLFLNADVYRIRPDANSFVWDIQAERSRTTGSLDRIENKEKSCRLQQSAVYIMNEIPRDRRVRCYILKLALRAEECFVVDSYYAKVNAPRRQIYHLISSHSLSARCCSKFWATAGNSNQAWSCTREEAKWYSRWTTAIRSPSPGYRMNKSYRVWRLTKIGKFRIASYWCCQ